LYASLRQIFLSNKGYVMKKHFLLIAALVSAFTLAACGGGSNDSTEVAAADIEARATPATTAAVVNKEFEFNAVPAFGTTATTTLAFTSTATTPAFSIESGGMEATGVTEFGSCIFRVQSSTFPADSPLATGKTVRVDPCEFEVAIEGAPADGSPSQRSITLTLGNRKSAAETVTVTVNPDGTVVINNRNFGTVVVEPVTGS
jgi:hypothetical protein